MGISNKEIQTVVKELRHALLRDRIQKIYQPSEYAVTMELRGKGKARFLHFCIHPNLSRVHLIEQKYENPPTPFPFCMFLRKYLTGALIEAIDQQNRDRIVRFTLSRGKKRYQFIAELFGRRSELILVDEEGKILQTALPGNGRDERLKPGGVYSAPQKQARPNFFSDEPITSHQDSFFLTKGSRRNTAGERNSLSAKDEDYDSIGNRKED